MMCREIILALQFLGINTEKFSELKRKFGSLEKLHNFVENKLS